VSPAGQVPVLVLDDGAVITQSVAIMEHIADTHPQANLLAKPGSVERAQTLAWCHYAMSDILRTFTPIVRHEQMTSQEKAHDDLIKFANADAHERLAHVERGLAGKTWIMGDEFTIADAWVFFATRLAGWLEVDLKRYPTMRAYHQRIADRPATKRILQVEDLLD
jgi:glutathione S-transferase